MPAVKHAPRAAARATAHPTREDCVMPTAPVVELRNPGKSTRALATRIDDPRDTIDGNTVELFLSRFSKNVGLSCFGSCVRMFELWRVTVWRG